MKQIILRVFLYSWIIGHWVGFGYGAWCSDALCGGSEDAVGRLLAAAFFGFIFAALALFFEMLPVLAIESCLAPDDEPPKLT